MNYQEQDTRGRKIKLIAVGVIAAVIVVFVGIWLISAAMSSVKNRNNTETVATAEPETTQTVTVNTANSSESSPANEYTATETNNSNSRDGLDNNEVFTPEVTTANETPNTGPSDVLLSALMLGVVVYLISLNLNPELLKRKA